MLRKLSGLIFSIVFLSTTIGFVNDSYQTKSAEGSVVQYFIADIKAIESENENFDSEQSALEYDDSFTKRITIAQSPNLLQLSALSYLKLSPFSIRAPPTKFH